MGEGFARNAEGFHPTSLDIDSPASQEQTERVPDEELHLSNGRVWYIPHHGIYHPQKLDKIRVVFDASTELKGESLNRHLLPGSDLTNSLNGVHCRFCKEPIAFTCDVEGMFYQVYVSPAQIPLVERWKYRQ